MPQAHYTVSMSDGVWTVGLGTKVFGPYSTLDTAVAAASNAARRAENLGYEAFVNVQTPDDGEVAPAPNSERQMA